MGWSFQHFYKKYKMILLAASRNVVVIMLNYQTEVFIPIVNVRKQMFSSIKDHASLNFNDILFNILNTKQYFPYLHFLLYVEVSPSLTWDTGFLRLCMKIPLPLLCAFCAVICSLGRPGFWLNYEFLGELTHLPGVHSYLDTSNPRFPLSFFGFPTHLLHRGAEGL